MEQKLIYFAALDEEDIGENLENHASYSVEVFL